MERAKDIDDVEDVDWGRVSEDYAKFRDIYPDAFYEKIIELGLCVEGQEVLDIATGTGVLPRNLYKHGAGFTGLDISENQIGQARRLTAEAGMDITYLVSPAETAPLPNDYFDVVTACQCYVYLDKDIIFSKVHSMLKDSGHFCILFMGWITEESKIASESEKLVLKYNPSWPDSGIKRFLCDFPEQAQGLFEVEDSFCYDLSVTFTRENWHGRMKACRGIGASSLAPEAIAEFEKEHLAFLQSAPEVFEVPHFATVLNLRRV